MSKDFSGGNRRFNRKSQQRNPQPNPQASDVLEPEIKVTINTLSPHDRKAEAWARHDAGEPMYQDRCHECNKLMWTWSEREDICETCGFELRQKREELRRMRDQPHEKTGHNAFERRHDQHVKVGIGPARQKQVNPFQSEPAKPHAVGITANRRFHNPFVR